MKSKDIIEQLATLLPTVSDRFTTNVDVSSLSRVGNTVTVDTVTPHGLSVGSQVNIFGAKTPIIVDTLTRVGPVGTLVVLSPHDFTENFSTIIELINAVEPEFNGTFSILDIPNRLTVNFTIVDSGPLVATGTPLLVNGSSALQQYNGLKNVLSTPTTTSFTYNIADATLFTPAEGDIKAKTLPRISGGISPERLVEAYSKQPQDELWAFAVLEDVFASKSRNIVSDAVDNIQRGCEFRQQLIQPFSILVFFPTSDSIAALKARDDAEDVFVDLCKSILFSKLDSYMDTGKQNPVQFVGHGVFAYNTAFYAHTYNFQMVADLTFRDTVGYSEDVAFRDISVNMGVNVGSSILLADLDLDDTPL